MNQAFIPMAAVMPTASYLAPLLQLLCVCVCVCALVSSSVFVLVCMCSDKSPLACFVIEKIIIYSP